MKNIPITIAAWDYDRVRALIDGRVGVEGCDVTFIALTPEECFHRAYRHREFEVSEIGFSPYINSVARGIPDYVAIPAFVSRSFRHSAIYIRDDRGIDSPADLKGRRVGVPEYQLSAALWPRGMLADDYGIKAHQINWLQGGLEQPGRDDRFPLTLPAGFPLEKIPQNATLSGMLEAGQLDALFTARAPSCYLRGAPNVRRLFEDFRCAEAEYFRRSGIFPIMHAVGIRRDMHERHPWLAASVYKAFVRAKRIADADLGEVVALKVGLPWVVQELAATRAVMGEDFWPYGVSENRKTLEAMTRYSFEQGISLRRLGVEELFAPSTLDDYKI